MVPCVTLGWSYRRHHPALTNFLAWCVCKRADTPGERMLLRRTPRRLSQTQLRRSIGGASGSVSRGETGKRMPMEHSPCTLRRHFETHPRRPFRRVRKRAQGGRCNDARQHGAAAQPPAFSPAGGQWNSHTPGHCGAEYGAVVSECFRASHGRQVSFVAPQLVSA